MDGRRKRDFSKETWRRRIEREMSDRGWTRGQLDLVTTDRNQWRSLADALGA